MAGLSRSPKEDALSTSLYPKANSKIQWFANAYPGDHMPHPNVVVLHTTEGGSWPSYSGGALAPTLTYMYGAGWRQHFPLWMSARALENRAGGVQTNTLNVIQVELVGTCDPKTAERWRAHGLKPEDGAVYWPEAPDEALADLADFLRFVAGEYPIPLVSTPKPWLPYPSSYGTKNGQRMSFSQWESFSGICGHQHVPEQDHGDPGHFPIERLLALLKPKHVESAPKPAPVVTPRPRRYFVDFVMYAQRGPDYDAAAWYLSASRRKDASLVASVEAARAGAAAGAKVVAVGGPACDELKDIAGLIAVNGKDAVETGHILSGGAF